MFIVVPVTSAVFACGGVMSIVTTCVVVAPALPSWSNPAALIVVVVEIGAIGVVGDVIDGPAGPVASTVALRSVLAELTPALLVANALPDASAVVIVKL